MIKRSKENTKKRKRNIISSEDENRTFRPFLKTSYQVVERKNFKVSSNQKLTLKNPENAQENLQINSPNKVDLLIEISQGKNKQKDEEYLNNMQRKLWLSGQKVFLRKKKRYV